MAVNELSFGKTWESSTDFPTIEPNEAQVRADLQYHPDAIKDYINETLVPAVNSLDPSKYAKTSDIPTKTSQLTNDSGFLTSHQSLTAYAKTSDVDTKLAKKQDTLTAGDNITISGNVISANSGGSGGGSDVLVITATGDPVEGFTVDKTYAQVKAAFPKVVLLYDGRTYTNCSLGTDGIQFFASTELISTTAAVLQDYVLNSDGTFELGDYRCLEPQAWKPVDISDTIELSVSTTSVTVGAKQYIYAPAIGAVFYRVHLLVETGVNTSFQVSHASTYYRPSASGMAVTAISADRAEKATYNVGSDNKPYIFIYLNASKSEGIAAGNVYLNGFYFCNGKYS